MTNKLQRRLDTILMYAPLLLLIVSFAIAFANAWQLHDTANNFTILTTTLTNFSDNYFQIVENTFINGFYTWLSTNIFANVTSNALTLINVIFIVFTYEIFFYFIKLLFDCVFFIFRCIDNFMNRLYTKGGKE